MLTLSSDFSASMSVPRAVYAILNTCVEKYPGDFVQPPEFPSLHTLLAYLQVNVPGSDLQRRAQLLLPERQRAPRKTTKQEAGGSCPRAAAPCVRGASRLGPRAAATCLRGASSLGPPAAAPCLRGASMLRSRGAPRACYNQKACLSHPPYCFFCIS
uniref:Uncharacterized protein n=1 Tax=Mustela putorius furo TaxID=9669 RepID=M3YKJ9_MUSPF